MTAVLKQPENHSKKYAVLLADIDAGRTKLPMFQRDFVWDKSQTAKLIDSILKGFPVGTRFQGESEGDLLQLGGQAFGFGEFLGLPFGAAGLLGGGDLALDGEGFVGEAVGVDFAPDFLVHRAHRHGDPFAVALHSAFELSGEGTIRAEEPFGLPPS